jgi:hypothetical protein
MKIVKSKTPSPETNVDLSTASLDDLKKLLKERGDVGPKYLFNAVKEIADVRDYRYVFWLDLMGARNAMKLSLSRAARSIMKIHAAALLTKARHDELEINPVMDGVYGFVEERESLETCLGEILTALANVFVQERVPCNRFMVRAGVAYGPLIPGRSLAEGAEILQKNKSYLGGTAIGMAISHAYEAEGCAPPFGIYIHESARAFAPRTPGSYPYLQNLWRWFDEDEALTWATRKTLLEHFDWLEKNPVSAQYDAEALRRHRNLAVEYFELYKLSIRKADNV